MTLQTHAIHQLKGQLFLFKSYILSYTFTMLCSKITTVPKLYRSNHIFEQLKAFFWFLFDKKDTQYKRVVVRSLKALFCSISIQLFPCVGQEPQQHDWCWNLFRPLSCYSGRAGTPTKRWWETNKQLCVCTLHLLMRSSPVRLRLTDKNTACFWGTSMPLSL